MDRHIEATPHCNTRTRIMSSEIIVPSQSLQPYLPDIEVARETGNLTAEIAATVLKKTCPMCFNHSETDDGQHEWTDTVTSILFYANPILIVFGLFTTSFSFVICVKNVKRSYDVYMLGFTGTNVLVLLTGGCIRLEDYMSHSDSYQYVYTYILMFHNWFRYTSLWLLLCMSIERFSTMCSSSPSKALCTPLQAGLVTVAMMLFCCICAVPQLWEFTVTQTTDLLTNKVKKVYTKSQVSQSTQYTVVYFIFKLSMTVFFPYPVLIILVICLIRGIQRKPSELHYQIPSLHRLQQPQTDNVKGESKLNVLFVVEIILYFSLAAPSQFLDIIDHISPHSQWNNDGYFQPLKDILDFMMYFYYSIQLFVCTAYLSHFKTTTNSLCCCGQRSKCTLEMIQLEA